MPSQGAPAAQKVDPQMPMGLEQTVKEMMQQMESFKRDSRLQHLFVQGEASNMAYDVPKPSRSPTSKRKQQQEPSSTSSSSTSNFESSSSNTSQEPSRRGKTVKKKKSNKPKEFKEGGKYERFITFNGRYGQAEKAVQFVRQFDAAFGSENFLESSVEYSGHIDTSLVPSLTAS